VLYLAQGEYKKTWWVSKPLNPTLKNCASSIVRVATAAILTLEETSAWTLKSSPNFPLLQDAQLFLSTKKNLKLCDCTRAVTIYQGIQFRAINFLIFDSKK